MVRLSLVWLSSGAEHRIEKVRVQTHAPLNPQIKVGSDAETQVILKSQWPWHGWPLVSHGLTYGTYPLEQPRNVLPNSGLTHPS